MRLSTAAERNDDASVEVIRAAIDAGVEWLDTAPTYGWGQGDEHHNERLVARARRGARPVQVATKVGMTRAAQAWVPDGRASAIRRSCEASLRALGGEQLDLVFLHAPDPRTAWRTSVRALAMLRDEGLARRVGISNVSLAQLDEALEVAPIDAVQNAWSWQSEASFQSGVVQRAVERSIDLFAHSPLGGPKQAPKLLRDAKLAALAESLGISTAQLALAWLASLHPRVVPLPGATRVSSAQQAARVREIVLDEATLAQLDALRPAAAIAVGRRSRRQIARRAGVEVVVIMGIQGAGKTSAVGALEREGYERLNRDERGGTLAKLHRALDQALEAGGTRFVLDNTYPSRASRAPVLEIGARHGASLRCVFMDTPLELAQANVIERMVRAHGELPTPETLPAMAKRDAGTFAPTAQLRVRRELEAPDESEGWDAIEVLPFERRVDASRTRAGLVLDASALGCEATRAALRERGEIATLVIGWEPDDALGWARRVREALGPQASSIELACCDHPAGPPRCWCRPPLPGLVVAWAARHGIDPAHARLIGASRSFEAMARSVGYAFVDAGAP